MMPIREPAASRRAPLRRVEVEEVRRAREVDPVGVGEVRRRDDAVLRRDGVRAVGARVAHPDRDRHLGRARS